MEPAKGTTGAGEESSSWIKLHCSSNCESSVRCKKRRDARRGDGARPLPLRSSRSVPLPTSGCRVPCRSRSLSPNPCPRPPLHRAPSSTLRAMSSLGGRPRSPPRSPARSSWSASKKANASSAIKSSLDSTIRTRRRRSRRLARSSSKARPISPPRRLRSPTRSRRSSATRSSSCAPSSARRRSIPRKPATTRRGRV